MIKSGVAKFFSGIVFLFWAGSMTFAQFSSDSPGVVSAALARLFGSTTAFIARADVQMLDTNRQESLRMPMGFAFLDRKMRLEIDVTQMKGRAVTPLAIAAYKKTGLDRMVSVIRLDRKLIYLVFTNVHSYVQMELTANDAAAAETNLQIRKTPLGNETIDGHPCAKNKVVVATGKGALLLEATTWNASDLKEFPVQIAMQSKDNTTVLHFTGIQFVRPAAAQFEPPAGYAKYLSPDVLLIGAVQRQVPRPRVVVPQRTNSPATKPNNPAAKSATTKK
jgi:hypothetical protein